MIAFCEKIKIKKDIGRKTWETLAYNTDAVIVKHHSR